MTMYHVSWVIYNLPWSETPELISLITTALHNRHRLTCPKHFPDTKGPSFHSEALIYACTCEDDEDSSFTKEKKALFRTRLTTNMEKEKKTWKKRSWKRAGEEPLSVEITFKSEPENTESGWTVFYRIRLAQSNPWKRCNQAE